MSYPMGFWNTVPGVHLEQVQDWEDLGFTMPITPHFDPEKDNKQEFIALLDAIHAKGMKTIVTDSRSYWRVLTEKGEQAYREGYAALLKDFGGHPAVSGFHVGDEPDAPDFDDACHAVAIQEEMSPGHTAYLNLLPWHYGFEDRGGDMNFDRYLDDYCRKSKTKVISYDCYTQMNPGESGFDMYFNNLRMYWQASLRNKVPFWTILLGIGHFNYRTPSYEDVRWQLSTAAAHGAKGIMWFYIYQFRYGLSNYRNGAVNEHGRRTDVFYRIADNSKTFVDTFGDTLLRLNLDHVWHYGRTYGGFPMFNPDERTKFLTSTNDCPLILSYFTSDTGEDFLMLVNNSVDKNTYAKLTLRGNKKIYMCYVGNEIREISTSGDSPHLEYSDDLTAVGHWLSAGQAILLKYEDSGEVLSGKSQAVPLSEG